MSEDKPLDLQEAAQKAFIPKIVVAVGTPPAQTKVILVHHHRGPELYVGLTRGEANILQSIYNASGPCSYEQLLEIGNIKKTTLSVDIFRINEKLAPFNIKIEAVRLSGYVLQPRSKKILMRIITDDLYDALEAEAPSVTGKLKHHSIMNERIMYKGNTFRHTVLLEDAEEMLKAQRALNSHESRASKAIRVLPSENSIRKNFKPYNDFLKSRTATL